ncbi:unnamed protein product [Phytophthora fragariaefolia]|uniref:Unnamed protein product n=1 Tax=Phytophthora fragariaefolia TaxID=1490495 RepID=A0A9W6U0I8_9STRA|nr:unnamed protein product [Phytophthora fragariaefolia]
MSKLNCFSKLVLYEAESNQTFSSFIGKRGTDEALKPRPPDLQTLLHVLMQTALWLCSGETTEWITRSQPHLEETVGAEVDKMGRFTNVLFDQVDAHAASTVASPSVNNIVVREST